MICFPLQLCYETCMWVLLHHVTEEAVKCWRSNASAFSSEVSVLIQDSMADECHDVSYK